MQIHIPQSFLGTNRTGESYQLLLGHIQLLHKAFSKCHCNFASCLGDKWYGGWNAPSISSFVDMWNLNCGLLLIMSSVCSEIEPEFSKSWRMCSTRFQRCANWGLLYHTETINAIATTRWFMPQSRFLPTIAMLITQVASLIVSLSGSLSRQRPHW